MPPSRKAANRVRIIGGEFRRRMLEFPAAEGLRPTPDRVRETLFNWLGQDLHGFNCLDLFAGSGALGFEAASRGAARVVMVESERSACEALKRNREMLGAAVVDIQRGDALSWLTQHAETFDLVFLDPPFASDLAGRALALLAPHLKPDGQVYVEQRSVVTAPPGFIIRRSGRAGQSHYVLLTKENPC